VRFWALRFKKSFVVILILAMATTIISQIGYATLSSNFILPVIGTIVPSQVVHAGSGSAKDIQNALNIAAAQGITKVVIPEGTFDFVKVGESWMTVNVPDGVSIFGASTERTSGLPVPVEGMNPNNQVVEWRTVLRMPFEAPEGSWWFSIRGDGVRVSDIKMVGYRDIDPSSTRRYTAFDIRNSANFRIDHVYLRNICGVGVNAMGANGVVDHSRLVNNPVYVHPTHSLCSVWYGVAMSGTADTSSGAEGPWETNIQDVLGKYTSRTVFIEDNYFEGWRHVAGSNRGGHYVFRYNTERKNGYGSIDGHGYENSLTSTRCIEAYGNDFGNAVWGRAAVFHRGGGGVYFNNLADDTYGYVDIGNPPYAPTDYCAVICLIQKQSPITRPEQLVKDVWIWGNTIAPGRDEWSAGGSGITENQEFFLREPDQALDGFTYTPYVYPHPLVTD